MKQVEHFLAQSSEHMSNALNARVVITCQDLELRYLWLFNPGKEFANVVGKKMSDFATKEQYEPIEALKLRVIKSGKAMQKVMEIPYKGQVRTYDMIVTPSFHEGELVGVTTVTVDLTDLLAAQEELHKANARLLGLLGDAVMQGKTVIRAV
jgi:hypothetical protein